MLIRRFKRAQNDDLDMEGWLMVGAPSTYIPLSGMGIAHDLMEHRKNDQGTVEDELLAFGATLYVRGEGGYWWRKGNVVPPGEHLGGEIANDLGIKYEGIENGIEDPGRTRRLESHVEEWISQAMRTARSELKDNCCHNFTFKQVEEFLTRAVGWMRRGYRMAAKRYHGISVDSLAHLYAEVEKQADLLLKDDMSHYCEMVIRINPRKGFVQVSLDESALDEEWN